MPLALQYQTETPSDSTEAGKASLTRTTIDEGDLNKAYMPKVQFTDELVSACGDQL